LENIIIQNISKIQVLIQILHRNGTTDEDKILELIIKLKWELTEKIRRMSKEVNLSAHLSRR
jgi:hypothetical protein